MLYLANNDRISVLPFTARLYNALNRIGLNTIGALLNYDKGHSWSDIHALGDKSVCEIREWLEHLKQGTGGYTLVSEDERSYLLSKALISELLQYIPVREIPLSASAKNSLLEARMMNLAQVAALSEKDLLSLKRMGKKSAGEIMEFCADLDDTEHVFALLSEYTAIDPGSFGASDAYLEKKAKAERAGQWDEMINELVNSWGGEKETYSQILTDILEKYPEAQGETVCYLLYDAPFIREQAKEKITQMIAGQMDGITRERLERYLPNHLKNTTIPDEILVDLENEGKLRTDEESICYVYPSFRQCLSEFDLEKDQRAVEYMKLRLEGKTLAEIGERYGVTRERIRQVTVKLIRKIRERQNKGTLPAFFAEDQYRYIFETYNISRDDFLWAFDESLSTYCYLVLVGEAKAESKLPLDASLEDESISIGRRRQLERIVYKDYIYLDGAWIKKSQSTLVRHFVRMNCRNLTGFDDFVREYHQWLEGNGLLNEQCMINDGTYENRLQESDYVLWNQWRRFRSYTISDRDFSDVIACIDFEQYENTEISTLKLFRDFPEIMQEYDIRNEYELHNLLRKIWPENDNRITFHRMPNIEIGKANREEQVLNLLLQYAPVSVDELAQKYEEAYGARVATVKANYFRGFDEYFYNGMYSIDADNLPQDHFDHMKELLVNCKTKRAPWQLNIVQ